MHLIRARRSQGVVGVGEDHVRWGDHGGGGTLDRGIHVVDREIEQRAGRAAVEQQPNAVEVEEEQPGRIEPSDRRGTQQPLVEGGRPVEVVGTLRDLLQMHAIEDSPRPPVYNGTMPTNDPYRDRDLVVLYDLDNPGGADHDWYRALADDIDVRRIIDLGCGTGLLTRTLAAAQRQVTGVDPSETMLEFARRQPGADAIAWVLGDASVLPRDGVVDLLVCTGNAIMHVTRGELPSVVAAVAESLRRGGVFAFETRNPEFREWDAWTPEATRGIRDTPLGPLEEWIEVTSSDDGTVVFDAHNVLPDGSDRVYTSVLTVHSAGELVEALSTAGFADIRITGTWAGAPVDASSRLLIVEAVRG